MLQKASDLVGLTLHATDGKIGHVRDLFFDDQAWAVRYIVADTDGWLSGRRVLISPQAADAPDIDAGLIPVALTRQQIEDSPPVSEDEPVSRQVQRSLALHYNWEAYWTGYLGPGMATVPPPAAQGGAKPEQPEPPEDQADPHLRSLEEISGYDIQARDGEIGHLEDAIVQTDGWVIRYFVVDTRDWLPGKHVLVSPAWITDLNWPEADVSVDMPRQSVKDAPEYDPAQPPGRAYETRLYEYYGLPVYWQR